MSTGYERQIEVLRALGASQAVTAAVGSSNRSTAIVQSAVTLVALGTNVRIAIGDVTVQAANTGAYSLILADERVEYRLRPGQYIAVISQSAAAGTLEITELD